MRVCPLRVWGSGGWCVVIMVVVVEGRTVYGSIVDFKTAFYVYRLIEPYMPIGL